MRISMGTIAILFAGCAGQAGFQMGGSSSASAGAGGGGTVSSGESDAPASGAVATADKPQLDDFSWELQQYTGRYAPAFVTNKLTTFKVSPTCWKKMQDKDQNALHTASFYTRDILEYGKHVTGKDWSAIEDQNHGKNARLIEPMMADFANRFMVTVAVEGTDCDTTSESLWLRYWYTIGTAVKDYPPTSGKVFVTLNVTPSTDDIVADVVDDSHVTITASRDIEPRAWTDKIEKAFKRLNR